MELSSEVHHMTTTTNITEVKNMANKKMNVVKHQKRHYLLKDITYLLENIDKMYYSTEKMTIEDYQYIEISLLQLKKKIELFYPDLTQHINAIIELFYSIENEKFMLDVVATRLEELHTIS